MEYPLASRQASGLSAIAETGSTNRDLLALADSDQLPEFYTLVTEYQSAGRGRLDRSWEAQPGSSVMASVLLRPNFQDSSGIGWLSLMAALAISDALSKFDLENSIKWPNDVLVGGKKISGVLAEASRDLSAIVVGFGINVHQQQGELPVPTATSLVLAGASSLDRDQLLANILNSLAGNYRALSENSGDAQKSGLREKIIGASSTIGQMVEVSYPDKSTLVGKAIDIDQSGRLVISSAEQTHFVSAGDVEHLRSA